MSKVVSRTVHVTVTVAVEVPASEAITDRDARIYAQNHWHKGSEFDCFSRVFDKTFEHDIDKQNRDAFRSSLGLVC